MDDKPCACTDCGKYFSNLSNLALNKKIHMGQRPYHCALCGEGFISDNHVKRHMKNHADKARLAKAGH